MLLIVLLRTKMIDEWRKNKYKGVIFCIKKEQNTEGGLPR